MSKFITFTGFYRGMKVTDNTYGYTFTPKKTAANRHTGSVSFGQNSEISKKASDAISYAAKAKIAAESVPEGYEGAHRLILALKNNPEYVNIRNILDEYALVHIEGQKFLNYDDGIRVFEQIKNKGGLKKEAGYVNSVFQNQRVNDIAALFDKINKDKAFQLSLPFYEIEKCGLLNTFNLSEILGYINSKHELLPNCFDIDELTYFYEEKLKKGQIVDFRSDRIIPQLEKLSEFAKAAGEKAFGCVSKNLFTKTILSDGTYVQNLNPERFDILRELVSDDETEKLAKNMLHKKPEFLEERGTKLSILQRNTDIIKKYAKLINENEFDTYTLINFRGNLLKLLETLSGRTQGINYEKGDVKFSINPENSRVTINDGDRYVDVYDAQMHNLFDETRYGVNYIDKYVYRAQSKDKQNNIEYSVTQCEKKANSAPVLSEIVKSGINEKEVIQESSIDGIFDYYKLLPDNTKIPLTKISSDKNGVSYEKNLVSFDGTKTNVKYRKNNSFEAFDYIISDKDNNLLVKRQVQIKNAGNGFFEHFIDGKKYIVHHTEDAISVFNTQNGKPKTIMLKELIKNSYDEFESVLRTLFADELEFLNDRIKSIDSVEKLFDSRIVSDREPIELKSSDLICAPEKAVILHELGHEKFRNSSLCKEFYEIYEKERKMFKENMPPVIQDIANYFLEATEHVKMKISTIPLEEAAAETNVIINAPFFFKETCSRTHFLQQYFPRTIAFLMKHHL